MSPRWIRIWRARLGSAEAIWRAEPSQLRAGDVPPGAVAALLTARAAGWPAPAPEVEKAQALGYAVLSLWEDGYPGLLKRHPDPPLLLYSWGELREEDEKAVAIVGTRLATPYGRSVAERLARGLAAAGLTVVSGLARGIDTCAHQGALAAGGRTVAVIGSGLDRLYPAENRELAARIAARGAVLSEYPPGVGARSYHFPHRNRLIAGLSLGVVVVEAPRQSGALSTADHALALGRPVMAVPGPVTSRCSVGCNRLIRDGAHLVEGPEDVLATLGTEAVVPRARAPALEGAEARVFALLEEGASYDSLYHRSGLSRGELAAVLLSLEMRGLIRRLPGQTYIRVT